MVQFADLVEEWVAGTCSLGLLLLAFHHIAMAHGAYARKKTLRVALTSSIEELSQRAPLIFPPDRVVKLKPRKKAK